MAQSSEITDNEVENLIIIGAGPSGLTSAIYGARAFLNPLVIEGFSGGQLTQTPAIENWPGVKSIGGMELVNNIREHAKSLGARFVSDEIVSADFSKEVFELKGSSKTYYAKAIIIATGSSPKHLNIPSEMQYQGTGVSYCATCDGAFYRNQDVAVVGGGNSALVEAMHLSSICNKVYLIHRRDEFRAEKAVVDKLKNASNISLELKCDVLEITGNEYGVNGIKIFDRRKNENVTLPVTGVFIAVGHTPMSAPFLGQLELENGTIKTGFNGLATQTSVKGVFAAGDCADDIYRQAIVSAGTGAKAAIDVVKYLESLH